MTVHVASTSSEPNGDGIPSKLNLAENGVAGSATKSPPGRSPSLWELAIRPLLFFVWFNITCVGIVATQFIGVPLALWDKNIFYAYFPFKGLSEVDTSQTQRRASELR